MSATALRDLLWVQHPCVEAALRRALTNATVGDVEFKFARELRIFRFAATLTRHEGQVGPENLVIRFVRVTILGDEATVEGDRLQLGVCASEPWAANAPTLIGMAWASAYDALRQAALAGEIRFVGSLGSEAAIGQEIPGSALPERMREAQAEHRINFKDATLRLISGETFFRVSIEIIPPRPAATKAKDAAKFRSWLMDRIQATPSSGRMTIGQVIEEANNYSVSKKQARKIRDECLALVRPEIRKIWTVAGRPKK